MDVEGGSRKVFYRPHYSGTIRGMDPQARDAVERERARQRDGAKPPSGIAEPPAADEETPAHERNPHSVLNNPVVDDPDLTEYPDPYEARPDPRDPALVDTPAHPAEVTAEEAERIRSADAPSTSEPHPHDHDDEPGMGRTRTGEERARDRDLRKRRA